mgnify:CR=1 FL=1
MKLVLPFCILTLLGLGCANTSNTPVMNLSQVRPGIWRSGQPTTSEQWQYLYNLGIRHVVKLNFIGEGSDSEATRIGMTVHTLSIQPEGDLNIWDNITNSFMEPDGQLIEEAEKVIEGNTGVLVHCTYGRDRTGVVVGISRLRVEHWSKTRALEEMLKQGFSPALVGLDSFWTKYNMKGSK